MKKIPMNQQNSGTNKIKFYVFMSICVYLSDLGFEN